MIGAIVVAVLVVVCVWSWVSWLGGRGDLGEDTTFQTMYGGRVVFVTTTRWGWHEFVVNNVEPVLPSDAKIIWYRWYRGYALPPGRLPRPRPAIDIDSFWLRRRVVPPKTPYAFILNGDDHVIRELHDSLHPLKSEGSACDEHKQSVVAEELAKLIERAGS